MKQRCNAAKVPPAVSDTIRCPVCLQFATLTERGEITKSFRECFGHRWKNEPCHGFVGMKERVQA